MIKYLTTRQFINACKNNNYIAVLYNDNRLVGLNCKLINLTRVIKKLNNRIDKNTSFIGFKPINFMQYISLKVPFITQINKKTT